MCYHDADMNVRDFFYRNDCIVVFDTEFTTWEGSLERGWSGVEEFRELVQIAAQKISLKEERVLSKFEILVKPRINTILSDYFINLTGISQSQVDQDGVDFSVMYRDFAEWAKGLPKYAYSKQVHYQADLLVLKENVELYNLPYRIPVGEYGNLAAIYQSVGIDISQYSSGELYKAFGMKLDGHVHNAMHDVDSLVACLFATKRILLE